MAKAGRGQTRRDSKRRVLRPVSYTHLNNPVYRSHSNCMEPEWIRAGTFLLSHKDS